MNTGKLCCALTVQSALIYRVAPPVEIDATIIRVLQAEENNDGSNSHTGVQSRGQYVVVSTPPLTNASIKLNSTKTKNTYAEMVSPYPILEDEPG